MMSVISILIAGATFKFLYKGVPRNDPRDALMLAGEG